MKKKSLSALLLTVVLLMSCIVPMQAYTGSTVKDGIVQYGSFDSLIYGNIVFYPQELETSDQKWPVIVWANGTACPPASYTNLLTMLAKGGYIVVCSSEMMSADGEDQCDCIDFISKENEKADSVFYHKVDMKRVAAAGHSQGGRSTVNAAAQDSRIRCAVSIAGSSFSYEVKKLKVPTFFITGTDDLVVLSGLWVKPAYDICDEKGVSTVYASIDGGIHTSCWFKPEVTAKYTLKWCDAYLKDDKTAQDAFRSGGELSQDGNWTDYASANLRFGLTASIFSEGSLLLVIVLAGIAAAACVVAVIAVKRKKRTAKL